MADNIAHRITGDHKWSAFLRAIRRLDLTPAQIEARTRELFEGPIEEPAMEENKTRAGAH